MANHTYKAIIRTFEEMLTEMPFEKITVSALVERCEISSNTFYYHFKDIYDLLDAWNLQKKEEFVKSLPAEYCWTDAMKLLLSNMKAHPKQVAHLMKSNSRDRVVTFSASKLEEMMYAAIKAKCSDRIGSEEKIRDLAEFCSYATIGCILKFIHSGMTADIERTVDKLQFLIGAVTEKMLTE